jgi:hypothetical protein
LQVNHLLRTNLFSHLCHSTVSRYWRLPGISLAAGYPEGKRCAIFLTGFSALNIVLGHDVYLRNGQLGGMKIMPPNGIPHLDFQGEVHGIITVLDWLSFVPAARGQSLPIIESRDAVTRAIEVSPPPDGQGSDNAVIVRLVPPGKAKLAQVTAKTIALEDDSDAVSPRSLQTCSSPTTAFAISSGPRGD